MATENALLDESFSESAESARAAQVRELLRLLVKAQKAQRLYEGKNAVSERLEKDFYDRLTDFLETDGEIQLAVHEFELKCGHEIVYESLDRKDSLAFLLYRDGLRRLSLHPGVERCELEAFLTCLNRVALHANDQDDLVTLLWEKTFTAFAILRSRSSPPRLPSLAWTSSWLRVSCLATATAQPRP